MKFGRPLDDVTGLGYKPQKPASGKSPVVSMGRKRSICYHGFACPLQHLDLDGMSVRWPIRRGEPGSSPFSSRFCGSCGGLRSVCYRSADVRERGVWILVVP